MTENEATREMMFDEEYEILQKEKEELFAMENCDSEPPFANCVVRRASRCIRKLLEEIQQYRAIGTVEEVAEMENSYINYFHKARQYEAIGTVEEFRKLRKMFGDDFPEMSEVVKRILKEYPEYQSIGTIEEFKALKKEVELYRNLDKTNFSDGYNRAIDEFAEAEDYLMDKIKEETADVNIDFEWRKVVCLDDIRRMLHQGLCEIAEQLKAGGKNE